MRSFCNSKCKKCQYHYFEAKYKRFLAEEISIYFEENLKKIAKSKAENMCKPKIEVHEKDDYSPYNVKEVSRAWRNISDSEFLNDRKNTDVEKRESGTHRRYEILPLISKQIRIALEMLEEVEKGSLHTT